MFIGVISVLLTCRQLRGQAAATLTDVDDGLQTAAATARGGGGGGGDPGRVPGPAVGGAPHLCREVVDGSGARSFNHRQLPPPPPLNRGRLTYWAGLLLAGLLRLPGQDDVQLPRAVPQQHLGPLHVEAPQTGAVNINNLVSQSEPAVSPHQAVRVDVSDLVAGGVVLVDVPLLGDDDPQLLPGRLVQSHHLERLAGRTDWTDWTEWSLHVFLSLGGKISLARDLRFAAQFFLLAFTGRFLYLRLDGQIVQLRLTALQTGALQVTL